MAGFDTDPTELFAAEAQLTTAAEEGRSALVRLTAAADDVLGHGWTGRAAAAFDTGWHDWLSGAQEMLSALEELARAYGTSGREYAAGEQASVLR